MLGAGQISFGMVPGKDTADQVLHLSECIECPTIWITSQHLQRWLLLHKALQSLAQHSTDPELLSQNWELLAITAELALRAYAAVEAGTVLQHYIQF